LHGEFLLTQMITIVNDSPGIVSLEAFGGGFLAVVQPGTQQRIDYSGQLTAYRFDLALNLIGSGVLDTATDNLIYIKQDYGSIWLSPHASVVSPPPSPSSGLTDVQFGFFLACFVSFLMIYGLAIRKR